MNPIITSNDCVICYYELTNDTIKLPCNHIFHNECMNRWKQLNNNTCPYCRYNLNTERSPVILYDEIIVPDGNIDSLNEDNFRYFYYINEGIYTREIILYKINKIRIASQLKSTLLICEDYNIRQIEAMNIKYMPNFGKLIRIGQITANGIFPCSFQTAQGIRTYHSNYYEFIYHGPAKD